MSNVNVRYEGEFVLVATADGLLCFTHEEWSRAMKRGASILRNRAVQPRKEICAVLGLRATNFRNIRTRFRAKVLALESRSTQKAQSTGAVNREKPQTHGP
jgi:hypothetical protein